MAFERSLEGHLAVAVLHSNGGGSCFRKAQ